MIAKIGLDSISFPWMLSLWAMHRDYRIDIHEVEISQLDLRYAYTRIQMPETMTRLAASIECFGQITPVVCVLEGEVPLVLLDGYRRVAILKRLGRDMVWAQVWYCQVYQAMARNQERRWEALEEGALIQELCRGLGLTQARVAEMLGRDKSWVARRVALIEALPEGYPGTGSPGAYYPLGGHQGAGTVGTRQP